MASRGERTPEVSFVQSTVKSIVKALSGRTQASSSEDPVGSSSSGERNAAENWAHFAEGVLRSDATIEESPTGLHEFLLPSGTGIVKTLLSEDLVGEGIGQLHEMRFSSDIGPGFVLPKPEPFSVPARRSLSGVFGAPGIPLSSEKLRSSSTGPSQSLDLPFSSSPPIPGGDKRIVTHGWNSRFVNGGLPDCPALSVSQFANHSSSVDGRNSPSLHLGRQTLEIY